MALVERKTDLGFQGVDCAGIINENTAKLLAQAGKTFVCRYFNWRLSKEEAARIHRAGLALLVIHERSGKDMLDGRSAGESCARESLRRAAEVGVPDGVCIYYTADFDAYSQHYDKIEAYLAGARAVLNGKYKVGLYASAGVIEAMAARRAADCYWQAASQGWNNNSKLSTYATTYQYAAEMETSAKLTAAAVGLSGVDLDTCSSLSAAGMWLSNGKAGSGTTGLTSVAYDMTVTIASQVTGNVFVPRTVAPRTDDYYYQTSHNPCLRRYNGTVLPNCFVGSTKFISNVGVITLKKGYNLTKNGFTFDVPTSDGEWHHATVKSFGIQRIYKVILEGSTYYCTANHRWLIYTRRGLRAVSTLELTSTMRIPYRMCNIEPWTRVLDVVDTGRSEGVYCVVEPETRSFTLEGGELTGNCVGYAHGRFCEIYGSFYPGLPHCNAGDWIDALKRNSHGLTWGDIPKLGAVAVWKQPGKAGHVAVVEAINSDGTIMLSESGYSASWNTRFWTSGPRSGPNWYGGSYKFQGFIYNPATENMLYTAPFTGGIKYGTIIPSNSPKYDPNYSGIVYPIARLTRDASGTLVAGDSSLSSFYYSGGAVSTGYFQMSTAPEHPARKFVKKIIEHVGGEQALEWVKDKTDVKTQGWSAATLGAAAIDLEYADEIMPGKIYSCSEFCRETVEQYDGIYYEGGLRGGLDEPQTGDIFAVYNGTKLPDRAVKYACTRIGVVREVENDCILTVEGDLQGTIMLSKRRLQDIIWFVRPDWTKVGGDIECKSLFDSPLYETMNTSEDASVREVGYLNKEYEPSIKTERNAPKVKLSAINYTKVLSNTMIAGIATGALGQVTTSANNSLSLLSSSYVSTGGVWNNLSPAISGDRVTIQGASYSCAVTLDGNSKVIYDFLRQKGFNHAQTVAFLANIWAESNFYPGAVNKSSGASGICQWLGSRYTAMVSRCGADWRNNMSGQLEFLWYELQSYHNETFQLVTAITSNSLSGCLEATDIILKKFEVPGHYDFNTPLRAAFATNIWEQLQSSNTEATVGNSRIITRSGKEISVGETVEVPSWVKQSGIIASYTNYNQNWSSRTNQGRLYQIWKDEGRKTKFTIATIQDYFLIAVTTIFGMPGDIVSVVLEDGTYFNAIIGDSKGDNVAYSPHPGETGNQYGHQYSTGIDVIEWESTTRTNSALITGLKQAGWYQKKVVKIVNFGSWIDG